MYRRFFLPQHPKADICGMVGEHILVVEKRLGRNIQKGEIIHHRDFTKANNADENLILMNRLQHQQLPAFQARFLLQKGLWDEWYTWWLTVRDVIDEEELLKAKLIRALNARDRIAGKAHLKI